ncbi:GNAT family N-acetyltransferase [Ciceribacter sp. L1K22]|uniref:GNAT family N-acetyltransferase n=1 Tax=Ciceribacter sp. L1K22 TaxID=2820275 RepID=UPI001ABDC2A1|nr:GNAT family N-acetyltransferase [Ciceribacter sp. L1K22]MBO3760500.1 GNAT family N-acetyltransferase [Ciceribacter sp. L1K22]
MDTKNPHLPMGYSPVPPGKLANVVTCLEMLEPPPTRPAPAGSLTVERWHSPSVEDYRDLFRRVGEDWMWVSRLLMAKEELAAILGDPGVEVYTLTDGRERLGLLELDFRKEGECELAFFGLVPEAIGGGSGRLLMNTAIGRAWEKPISRFWVHTCNFDSPAALPFYQRSGFKPYAVMVEVSDDPRLTGEMRRDAASHVPLIEVP